MDHKKVVIYARVSSREQEHEGFSIPAQLKLLKEYALKNGFQIVQEYSDAETAKKAGRTNYNAMLEYLKANPEVKTVLVEKTDRLYRNFKDYVTLEDYDLEVHLVKEGSIISKNSKSHDKFIHGIKVLMAKNYIDNLSEEISKGLHEGLEQGYWPFQPPYGYLRGAKKSLIIDKSRILFVRRAFELFATGKYSLKECLGDEQEYHKSEVERINNEIEQCKEILKKMYLDQVNGVLDYAMWVNLKNEYEVKLSRLNAELQKHTIANTNFLDTGLKILDLCSKASLPATELSENEVAQIVRATYLNVTVRDKKVKMVFKKPFTTIEKLIKLAKKEIAEIGLSEFKSAIISSKDKCIESIKKEPEGSDFNSSICLKWWRLGDSNS